MDTTALFQMSYGLYLITTAFGEEKAGCVVNTLSQVTASPIYLTVTLHKDNYTKQILEQSNTFSATVLDMEADMDLIGTFGFHSSKDTDKFKNFTTKLDTQGNPYVVNHANARFTCKVIKQVDLGTHVMFIGELIEAERLSDVESMTYAYYHQIKKGGTPKNAPSYQEAPVKKGWRCTICGYIYEGDPIPEDFVCPLCGAPASCFEKVDA